MKYEDLIEYLKEHTDTLCDMVCSCNGYDDSLEDLYWWNNDSEFYETMFSDKEEVARATYYGGNSYNFTDEYVRLNVYGNLESCSEWEYERDLQDNVEEILDTWKDLYSDDNVDTFDNTFKCMISDFYNTDEESGVESD